MKVVCLDLEGVLVPEIWIEFSKETGIEELRITTRDEPDYDKLMRYRIDILNKHRLRLSDIQKTIGSMNPLPGAIDFVKALRAETQLIILSDTFSQFAQPLMRKLEYPTLFCNELMVSRDDVIEGYSLRQTDGKKKAVAALQSLNMKVFASGDSYNDLGMLYQAEKGVLFCAPESICAANPELASTNEYSRLLAEVHSFI